MKVTVSADLGCVFDGRPVTPTLFERARGRFTGLGGFTHWSVLRRASARGDGTPRFLVRVDDFPRWDLPPDVFVRFHEILRDASIRYVLGVIPVAEGGPDMAPLDPPTLGSGPAEPGRSSTGRSSTGREWTSEERGALEAAGKDLDVALHGLTHRAAPGPIPAEIVGRDAEDLARDVDEGLGRLAAIGHRPRAYIPPFNAVDRAALSVLSSRFAVVHGGPESVRWLGCVPGPCRVDGVWFLPSYPPAYGRAGDVLRFVEVARDRRTPVLIPLTLHWAWEARDGFEAVRRLAGALAGRTVTFEEWEAGTSWRR